jgi:anti-sigma regulatory factor (Ser/Thr protein kinase)
MKDLALRLEGPLRAQTVYDLRAQFNAWMGELGAPGDDTYAAVSVLDEFGSNLMEHSGATWIELKAYVQAGRVNVELRDDGSPFDPSANGRDYSVYLQGDTDRNLGLFLVKKLTDDLVYARDEAGVNNLRFKLKVKNWRPEGN